MDFTLLGAEDNETIARDTWITKGAMVAGAIGGTIAGVKLMKKHSALGGILGFLGGSFVAGTGIGLYLGKKES